MFFQIVDANSNRHIKTIQSNNGKNALKAFRRTLTSTGFYEIHKICNRWVLSSTYGAYFVAMPVKDGRNVN